MADRIPASLTCPVCSGAAFRREHGRLSGKHQLNRFAVTMMICESCTHVLFFDGWHEAAADDGARL